eukprot:TRINITY_DN1269_c0_g1_i2.p3 TRINITY_DN1269_c0_g1~~TRINITY_DN1269_c0_g1_i2.p3  ORF type:complete len:131 (-),score=29.92 TRINITY_DN1269_c0_g1_i2:382-774(-)
MISWIVAIVFMCQIVPVFVRRYQIPPEEQPHPLAMACCQCCLLSQMARHMEDFERHPEKEIYCKCYNTTLDQPNPNYLWKTARSTAPVLNQPGAHGAPAHGHYVAMPAPPVQVHQPAPPAYSGDGASKMN